MKWINGFYLICIFLCVTPLTKGQYAYGQGFEKADSLFAAGHFFEASIAYERIYYVSESPLIRVKANLAKAAALKQMGDFEKARRDLQRSLSFRGNDSLRLEIRYQLIFSAYMAGRPAEAGFLLLQVRNTFDLSEQPRFYLVEALVLNEQERWDDLEAHVENWIMSFSGDSTLLRDKQFTYQQLLSENLDAINKSPEKARLWSTFIPGAGQLYAGEPYKAILNAFSQVAGLAGFGLLAYNALYVAGGVIGLGAFQSFYFGGIKQAGELTEENRKSRLDHLQAAIGLLLLDVAEALTD